MDSHFFLRRHFLEPLRGYQVEIRIRSNNPRVPTQPWHPRQLEAGLLRNICDSRAPAQIDDSKWQTVTLHSYSER